MRICFFILLFREIFHKSNFVRLFKHNKSVQFYEKWQIHTNNNQCNIKKRNQISLFLRNCKNDCQQTLFISTVFHFDCLFHLFVPTVFHYFALISFKMIPRFLLCTHFYFIPFLSYTISTDSVNRRAFINMIMSEWIKTK